MLGLDHKQLFNCKVPEGSAGKSYIQSEAQADGDQKAALLRLSITDSCTKVASIRKFHLKASGHDRQQHISDQSDQCVRNIKTRLRNFAYLGLFAGLRSSLNDVKA